MPFLAWRRPSLVEQAGEAVAVLGEVDHVGRGAEDRHVGLLQGAGELQRRLPAELDDDAGERSLRLLDADDLEHVLGGQRLEIEPVGGVVVGRHGLRVAVDHDRLVAGVGEREAGVAAAIVELDALADAVGAAAEDDHLLAVAGLGLVRQRAGERRLVGRIEIGGRRGELGGAGVDALVARVDVEAGAQRRHLGLARHRRARPAARRRSPAPSAAAAARRCPAGRSRGPAIPIRRSPATA